MKNKSINQLIQHFLEEKKWNGFFRDQKNA